jgi:hypothetical protein
MAQLLSAFVHDDVYVQDYLPLSGPFIRKLAEDIVLNTTIHTTFVRLAVEELADSWPSLPQNCTSVQHYQTHGRAD